jgi:acyl carrier protein
MGKTTEEVGTIVREYVTNEVAQILAISVERIEPLRSLHDMGLDSLMAVELALGLEQRIGVQLPVMMLNDSPTVEKVTGIILKKVLSSTDDEVSTGYCAKDMIEDIAKQHGDVVSDEILEKITDEAHEIMQRFPEGSK